MLKQTLLLLHGLDVCSLCDKGFFLQFNGDILCSYYKRVNHELKVAAQQVICQYCWQYQLAHPGCQGYRQVKGWTSHKNLLSISVSGNTARAQVVVKASSSKTVYWSKKTAEGKEEQIAHAAICVRDITAGSGSSNWVKEEHYHRISV